MQSRNKVPRSLKLLIVAALPLAMVIGLWLGYRQEIRSAWARIRYPRVVLVTFDTLNINCTGPYNRSVDYTPNLDRLAAEGLVFQRAYTTVPITLPSHASLMTGRTPRDLGVMLNGDSLEEEVETLAELLRRAGYRTAAFTSLGVVGSRFNLDQGFDHYDDKFYLENYRWYRTADEVFEAAKPWIRATQTEPFFVWLHFSDPHEPYFAKEAPPDTRLTLNGEPVGEWSLRSKERQTVRLRLAPGLHRLTWTSLRPRRPDDKRTTALRLKLKHVEPLRSFLTEPAIDLESEKELKDSYTLELENDSSLEVDLTLRFEGRLESPPPSEVREQYVLEVGFADRYLGELRRLFESLGLEEETLWIIASDHGEGLYRLQILGHAEFVQEDQLRVIWLMKGRGIQPGARVDTPVLLQDVLPTLLDLLGLETPEEVSGHTQTGCWRRSGCREREEWWAFGASSETGSITGVAGYRPPWKLIWQERSRSGGYNLAEDPWEQVNLGKPFTRDPSLVPPDIESLNRSIWAQRDRLQELLVKRSGAEMDPERLELLRSLGYLGN